MDDEIPLTQQVKKTQRKTRKTSAVWTEDLVEKLIAAVEKVPLLWDASLPDHRNKVKRDSEWKSMSENEFENGVDASDLNHKWLFGFSLSFFSLSFLILQLFF